MVNQWIQGVELGEKLRCNPSFGDRDALSTKNRILQVRYEDLRQDTFTHLNRIFEFIGLPVAAPELDSITAALSINNVKQKGEGHHIRKGIVDAWKDELSQGDIETCNRMAAPQLKKLGYEL